MRTRYVSALPVIVRAETMCSDPSSTKRSSWMPTEPRLRITSFESESKLTNIVRSPRAQAASAKAPLNVVFAVPGKPVINTLASR